MMCSKFQRDILLHIAVINYFLDGVVMVSLQDNAGKPVYLMW